MATTQSFEDLEAKYETKETSESVILVVHIPDGFVREHIGAKIEYEFSRVRIHGERSLGNNKRARFNALYQFPEYCDINKIKGKFDGKTVIITIPTIPGKVPKLETQPTEQEPPKEPSEEEESNPEEEKEGTPTDDNQDSKEEANHVTSTPPNATQESMHQKDQEGIPQKATLTKVESEKHVGQEASTSTPPKDTQESKGQEGIPTKDTITKVDSKKQVAHEASSTSSQDTPESKAQKGQEEICTKDTITKVDSKIQVGHEGSTSTPSQDTEESMPQKGQEVIPPNATLAKNGKLQGEENSEGEIDENVEKQKLVEKEETEDHSKKTWESGKPPEKAMVDDSPNKEGKEESKGLGPSEGEKRREINGKIGNNVGKKSDKKAIPESTTRARIKEVAASASQAITSLAKKFNEEDKQRIVYMGAAVLVVALGVYGTYKLRSRRP
ncbi:hypothetical protein glysoja_040625 [Glycine soja]|nr:hypothetical protein glysoja_040625 [Glycine soja]